MPERKRRSNISGAQFKALAAVETGEYYLYPPTGGARHRHHHRHHRASETPVIYRATIQTGLAWLWDYDRSTTPHRLLLTPTGREVLAEERAARGIQVVRE